MLEDTFGRLDRRVREQAIKGTGILLLVIVLVPVVLLEGFTESLPVASSLRKPVDDKLDVRIILAAKANDTLIALSSDAIVTASFFKGSDVFRNVIAVEETHEAVLGRPRENGLMDSAFGLSGYNDNRQGQWYYFNGTGVSPRLDRGRGC